MCVNRWILLLASLLLSSISHAATPIDTRPYSEKTLIAPEYFGPNAFPVPDMLDGRADSTLTVELAGDGHFGFAGDKTANLFARVKIPLWTDRVNLTVWMPIYEWYATTAVWRMQNRVTDNTAQGSGAGDVYVSTDIWILKAQSWWPDIAFRAAFKTASGGQYARARHYDNAGYWFDLSVGKSWIWDNLEFRTSGTAGFLCWQTDVGRQNDAVYYGLQAKFRYDYISATATWSGYVGWENDGDRPMVISGRISGYVKGFEPFIQYQYGIKNYPYQSVRVGLVYRWNFI